MDRLDAHRDGRHFQARRTGRCGRLPYGREGGRAPAHPKLRAAPVARRYHESLRRRPVVGHHAACGRQRGGDSPRSRDPSRAAKGAGPQRPDGPHFRGYKIVRTSEFLGATPNSDGSWSSDEPFEEGDSYEVLSEIPQPTGAQLRGAGSDYPSTVEEKFLQLPEDTPPVVSETADKIQRRYDPATPYDRARAIEQYLIYDGGFTYNLDVSYRRADKAVEEFLGDGKEGFCTQYSTSMALLLRDMNVPSRVVYGATSGEEVSQGEYLVRGSNMHTWVEAYFPGVGWYPFNPTPGFSMPDAMEANAR